MDNVAPICRTERNHRPSRGHSAMDFLFNPFEILIDGSESPGRHAFIQNLVDTFANDRDITLIQITDGDDDAAAKRPLSDSSVPQTLIQPHRLSSQYLEHSPNRYSLPHEFCRADLVLIDDVTNTTATHSISRITYLADGCDRTSTTALNNTESLTLAVVGKTSKQPTSCSTTVPYYHQSDVIGLRKLIDAEFVERAGRTPLYGLVLGGGYSTRMHKDKASIQYGAKFQSRHCLNLLECHCDQVFLSNRVDQADAPGHAGLPQLHDRFLNFGPMGGILTALHEHPGTAWLVLACDLPFVGTTVLADLVEKRCPHRVATAYRNPISKFPEPLCAVYEPKSIMPLMQFAALGYCCPRKILMNSPVKLLNLVDSAALTNVNTPDEFARAQLDLVSHDLNENSNCCNHDYHASDTDHLSSAKMQ